MLDPETRQYLTRILSGQAAIRGQLSTLTPLLKRLTAMSTETLAEIDTLKSDLATEITAIGPAISASVAAALTAAGVDDTTAQTALSALDDAVKAETATLTAMVAPAAPEAPAAT